MDENPESHFDLAEFREYLQRSLLRILDAIVFTDKRYMEQMEHKYTMLKKIPLFEEAQTWNR